MNDCYCRADLQAYAYQSLSRCISRLCTPSDSDLSSAAALYNHYCTANGYFPDDTKVVPTKAGGEKGGSKAGGGGNGMPQKTGGSDDESRGTSLAIGWEPAGIITAIVSFVLANELQAID